MNRKFIILLYTFLLVFFLFALTGCTQEDIEIKPEKLLKESFETMENIQSYVANAHIEISSDQPAGEGGIMKGTITYHQNPFSYSVLQELIATTDGNQNITDKIQLSLYVKDGIAYRYNSIFHMWDQIDLPSLIESVEQTANIFKNFSVNQFSNLKTVSIEKGKATIEGTSNNSEFLLHLMQSFDPSAAGTIQMVIDTKDKYLESIVYSLLIETEEGLFNYHITVNTHSFNSAPEIIVPEAALNNSEK